MRPTSGLALRLLCDDPMERWLLRAMLQADAPLVRHGLVRLTEEQPFLSRVLRADDRVIDHLVGLGGKVDHRHLFNAFAISHDYRQIGR